MIRVLVAVAKNIKTVVGVRFKPVTQPDKRMRIVGQAVYAACFRHYADVRVRSVCRLMRAKQI